MSTAVPKVAASAWIAAGCPGEYGAWLEAEYERLRGDLVAIGVAAAEHETIRGMVAETLWGVRATTSALPKEEP